MIEMFTQYLKDQGKSPNTIYNYSLAVKDYYEWFNGSFGNHPTKLLNQNVLEYKSYLQNIKKQNSKTVNFKLSSLAKYNEYLVSAGIQNDIVITKTMMNKIQQEYASPAKFSNLEVNKLRQAILETGSKRDYALITLLSYTGLRISESLNIQFSDLHIESRELVVRQGKGCKTRTVPLNDKVVSALTDYIRNERPKYKTAKNSPFLFVSTKNTQLDRITVNKKLKEYCNLAKINNLSPHDLRHHWCSHALENGFLVHEVANIAGHSNIQVTLLYTNPSRKQMLDKMNRL